MSGHHPAVVAIGVSTGGPDALEHLLRSLPGDFPVPIVIVQHMPPVFTGILADRLDARCALRVREAAGGEQLCRGDVWLAPGGLHLRVDPGGDGPVLALDDGPLESSCRPAVDVLFRSVARVYDGCVLAAVLTGMGSDGALGADAIVAAGGTVIVQDEASSAVWGMPGSVVERGLAAAVLPLDAIGADLVRRVSPSEASGAATRSSAASPPPTGSHAGSRRTPLRGAR